MKTLKKSILSMILTFTMMFFVTAGVVRSTEFTAWSAEQDIELLYTNNIRCGAEYANPAGRGRITIK